VHTKDLVVLDIPCTHKKLGGPVARSINGKHDDKYFEPNHDMQLSFKKTETICAKNQSRKIMIKNQVI
jgi:hypothetical protein